MTHGSVSGRIEDWRRNDLPLLFVCLGLAIITIVLNRPGHMSVDTVIQLHEGRTGIVASFNPPFMGFLLGLLDRLRPGVELFFVLNIGIFYGALFFFIKKRRAYRSWTLALLCLACLGPVLLVYNGTIWKDVFFANLSFFGFAMLAAERPGKGRLAVAALAFAMALLVRQQGALIALCGALCYALLASDRTKLKIFGRTVLAFVVVYGLSKLIFLLVVYLSVAIADPSLGTGFSILFLYDISGMAYVWGPQIMTVFALAGVDIPEVTAEIMRHYSDSRVDFLQFDARFHAKVNLALIWEQWLEVVRQHPLGYLTHRAKVFSWLLGLHEPALCLPAHVGLTGPQTLIDDMGLSGMNYPFKHALMNYVEGAANGPFFRPWIYLALGSVLCIWLRHNTMQASDRALLLLLAAGISYVASYFFFAIACDFRYTYLLVLGVSVSLPLLAPRMVAQVWCRYRKT